MFIHPSGYLLSHCKPRIVCQSDDTATHAMVGVVSHPANTNVGMCHVYIITVSHVMSQIRLLITPTITFTAHAGAESLVRPLCLAWMFCVQWFLLMCQHLDTCVIHIRT